MGLKERATEIRTEAGIRGITPTILGTLLEDMVDYTDGVPEKVSVIETNTIPEQVARIDVLYSRVVNVEDYGVIALPVTGSTNAQRVANAATNTPLIQQCLDENKGKRIYFPAGLYCIDDTLIVTNIYSGSGTTHTNNGSVLCGDGRGNTVIRQITADKDAVIFRPANYGVKSNRLMDVKISDIKVEIVLATGQTATDFSVSTVRFIQSYRFIVSDVEFGNSHGQRALSIEGSDRGYYDNLYLSGNTPHATLYSGEDSCLLYIADYQLLSGEWEDNWVHHFNKFLIELGWGSASTTSRYDTGILVTRGDGLMLENGYISGGRNSQIKIKPLHAATISGLSTASSISKFSMDNIYFDGNVDDRKLKYSIEIPYIDINAAVRINISDGCFVGNAYEAGIYSRSVYLDELICNANIRKADTAIDILGDVTKTQLKLNGNYMTQIGRAYGGTNYPGIKAGLLEILKLNGSTVDSCTGHFIEIVDDINKLQLCDNTNLSNVRDYTITTGTVTEIVLKGNVSSRSGVDQYNWEVPTNMNRYLWLDNSGKLRTKATAPTAHDDGDLIGMQS